MASSIAELSYYIQPQEKVRDLLGETLSAADLETTNEQLALIASGLGHVVTGCAIRNYHYQTAGDDEAHVFRATVANTGVGVNVVSSDEQYAESLVFMGTNVAGQVEVTYECTNGVALDTTPPTRSRIAISASNLGGAFAANLNNLLEPKAQIPKGDLLIAENLAAHDDVSSVRVDGYDASYLGDGPDTTTFTVNGVRIDLRDYAGFGGLSRRLKSGERTVVVPTKDIIPLGDTTQKYRQHTSEQVLLATVNQMAAIAQSKQ